MPYITPGETVRLTGVWCNHAEYGRQFKVETLEKLLPQSVQSVYAYLASGVISGIGASTARKITDRFGEETFEILANAPEMLTEIKGISLNKAMAMSESFIIRQETAKTVMFFQQYGISANLSMKIYKKYGPTAEELVRGNPYILCESVRGIGFKECDRLAQGIGIPFDNRYRVKSALRYALTTAAVNGHTCYNESALLEYTAKMLGCPSELVFDCYTEAVISGSLIKEDSLVYLPSYYNYELSCAARLAALAKEKPKEIGEKLLSLVDRYALNADITLSSEQRNAIIAAATQKAVVITGGPGTGKTTIMKGVLSVLLNLGKEVALCAPTGKAAKRLEESCGCEAKTIHRLLEVGALGDDEQRFGRNETNPINADYIIVDEMSMVDLQLFDALLKAMKRGCGIIMAGDCDQLPSVGAGNVLQDITQSGVVSVFTLSRVFRQAEESLVVVNAHKINDGEMPDLSNANKDFFFMPRIDHSSSAETIAELVCERLPKAYGYDPLWDIQVLSPSKKGLAGVNNLNSVIRERLNPPAKNKAEYKRGETVFRIGDKVIQVKNDYDAAWINKNDASQGFGIFNGDIGIITSINKNDRIISVEFDDGKIVEYDFLSTDHLEIAYALTVHKSQGCEFKAVIIPVCGFAPMLMARNLLYTAITRAKEIVVLVGQQEAVRKMVCNNHRSKRYTGLTQKLRAYLNSEASNEE